MFKMTDEHRENISNARKRMKFTPEHRKNISESKKGTNNPNYHKNRSKEHCNNISMSLKGRIGVMSGKHHSAETKQKIRESNKKFFNQPFIKAKISNRMRGKPSQLKGKTYLEIFGDEKAAQEKINKFKKTLELTPEIRKKMSLNLNLKPNKSEIRLDRLIKDLSLPYRYVGDGSLLIGTLNPDFIHLTKNKVIELFGDYWHKNTTRSNYNEEGRNKYFNTRGYQLLVIWDSELKNKIELVKHKLISFEDKGGILRFE